MDFYKIKEDKKSGYSGIKNFLQYPSTMNKWNISKTDGIYYYWRLVPNNQDLMIMTKIKLEDLELVTI